LSQILRRGRLKSVRKDVAKFTSSIKSDRKLVRQVVNINKAHTVMLIEQKIVDPETGVKILGALDRLRKGLRLKASLEDVHMAVEEEVIKATGPEAGGNLHIAKSRNDQVSTAIRMALREELIKLLALMIDLEDAIIRLSKEHVETLLPGYTHLQPAQPITFAHYLLSFFDGLNRDLDRIAEAYARVDQSPMGAGALATTSFAISRERVADLLGFRDVIENSLDAVSSRDFILETLAAISILALDISRFVEDMILWCTSEFRTIELPDEFTSTSSIMPQKKNPETLEVIRARTGNIIGDLASSLAVMKALPSGYNLDLQEITPNLWNALETMKGSLSMILSLIPRIEVSKNIFQRPDLTFTTSTELANMLVRRYRIPFRTAHNIVGALARELVEENQSLLEVTPEKLQETAKRFAGIILKVNAEEVSSAVNSIRFVESHNVRGGPSKSEVLRMINIRRGLLNRAAAQLSDKKDRLRHAEKTLDHIVNSYLTLSSVHRKV